MGGFRRGNVEEKYCAGYAGRILGRVQAEIGAQFVARKDGVGER